MKKVQTYTPNEGLLSVFTNWAGDESTNNLPVSGKAIRELILSRLLMPFYLHYDQTGKAYRIFRDLADYNKWLEREEHPDDESYLNLEIANFIAPSPYNIKVTAYGSQVEAFDNTGRYVRQGVNNDSTKLKFHWEIEQDGDVYPDSMLVTYKIVNASELKIIQRYGPSLKDVTFDLFDYLSAGTNTITIDFLGEQSKVTKSIGLTIDVVVLKISAEFPYNNRFNSNTTYQFALEVTSTGNTTKSVFAYLDDNPVTNLLGGSTVIESTAPNPYRDTVSIRFGLLSQGKHRFLILAQATVNGETFCSNLLYYEFVVPEDVTNQVDYIVTKYSFDNVINPGSISDYVVYADLYKPFYFDWAYMSNSLVANKETVTWSFIKKSKANNSELTSFSYSYSETQKGVAQRLEIVPDVATTEDYDCILRATVGQTSYDYPVIVTPSRYSVTETAGYILKLNAVGKQNNDNSWSYTDQNSNTYSTAFTNFTWDSKSGWNNGALLVAENTKAVVDFAPFDETGRNKIFGVGQDPGFGRTVEIEFEFSSIGDSTEPLIKIGDYVNSLGIKITPNEASFVYENNPILTTNYKENERIKLAFIVLPENATDRKDSNLLWIVNNGILERCTTNDDIATPGNSGTIQIGNTTSKSKTSIYSIRCYDNAISYDLAFNNFAFDSSNINQILQRNDVFDDYGNLDYNLVKTKIDTILITGQLDLILNMLGGTGDARKQVQIPVTVQRLCLENSDYNFIIKNCRIRAHGQSTLNYPIPSFKIWSDSKFNCSTGGAVPNNGVPEDEWITNGNEYQPEMYHGTDPETDCTDDNRIYKGRYSFKAGAIPSKKWVLQANYADSSCTHNGGILRLIQSTWYNARVDGQYVLRTEPQQFATNTGQYASTGWSNSTGSNKPFPYELRNSADSIPCVVFWKKTKASTPVFVGQFVFMDDKKSDFVYGERSIYNVPTDPFCFLAGNSDKDTDENRIWDNANVLRLEQTSANNDFASFLSLTKDGNLFDGMVGDTYNWEDDFELVYPEKEDILAKTDGLNKFKNRVKPFIDFYKWVIATKQDYDLKVEGGETDPDVLYSKFRSEASQHLDLYKIAAYYIFLLRFGLVDSLERNAQLKTYDGQHWHFEPWDMDIALGNNNQGQITFDPPINRNTKWGDSYAYSGRSTDTSNWLYDALEAWHTTSTIVDGNVQYTTGFLGVQSIVTKTAAALYDAGLTYDIAANMLDNNYSNKWCERIYNYSGHYKYIENGGSDYYTWLQGARTTHRHWWLKSSFDYWDAEWGVGSFLRNVIYMAVDAQSGKQISITPSTETYFGLAFEYTNAIKAKEKIQKDVTSALTLSQQSNAKKPLYLLGASYIKELDLSDVMPQMSVLNLSGCYDPSAGSSSNLKSLNIGIPVADMEAGIYNSRAFTISINESVNDDTGDVDEDAGLGTNALVLKDVESFNMQGLTGTTALQNATKWLGAMLNLKEFRSIGSTYTIFPGIAKGTTYNVLLLPSTVSTITLRDANWTFANSSDTNPDTSTGFSVWGLNGNDEFEQLGDSYYINVLKNLYMPGRTGENRCSYDLVKKIINAYKTYWSSDPSSADYYRKKLSTLRLEIENISWGGDLTPTAGCYLTYEELLDLGSFNGGYPFETRQQTSPTSFTGSDRLQGYIMMANENASSETLTQQFTTLQGIFGSSIFSKTSGGLTIDYEQDTIVLTVGQMPDYPSGKFQYISATQSDWKAQSTDVNYSDYYLVHEGYFSDLTPYRFPLSATKFMLSATPRTAVWLLYRRSGSAAWSEITGEWNGIELVNIANQEFVRIPELRNVKSGNITQPQDFKVRVTIEGQVKEAYIRVVPKEYPSLNIACVKKTGQQTETIAYKSSYNLTKYENTIYEFQCNLTYTDNNNQATVDASWPLTSQWVLTKDDQCPLEICDYGMTSGYLRVRLTRELLDLEAFSVNLACRVKFMASNSTFVQQDRTITLEVFKCVDPHAEDVVKMAYAWINSTAEARESQTGEGLIDYLELDLTKPQLGTLDIIYTPYYAAQYALKKSLTSPCSSVLHFPESRFLKKNGDIGAQESNLSTYINQYSNLISFIFPLESNLPLAIGRSCLIGAAKLVSCKYVDYGDRSQWNRYNDLDDSGRKQVMVFWQVPTYLYQNGNNGTHAPNNNNLILIPSSKAKSVYDSLVDMNNLPAGDNDWLGFPTSLKDNILVFEVPETNNRTAEQLRILWNKFYTAYTAELGEGVTDNATNRYANVVSSFRYDEITNPNGFKTIETYLQDNGVILAS